MDPLEQKIQNMNLEELFVNLNFTEEITQYSTTELSAIAKTQYDIMYRQFNPDNSKQKLRFYYEEVMMEYNLTLTRINTILYGRKYLRG